VYICYGLLVRVVMSFGVRSKDDEIRNSPKCYELCKRQLA